MALSIAERKERTPHGGQGRLAKDLRVFPSYVSAVVAGKVFPETKRTKLKLARAQAGFAKLLGLAVDDVFTDDEIARTKVEQLARAS